MQQMILLSLISPTLVIIILVSFYVGYRYGSKQSNKKLTVEQREAKRKRENIEDQMNRMFSYSITKAKEKRS